MTRIAVLGANGQVGAEVCLILRARGADVVPVARNRFGSAFLRYHGVACRHGLPTDPHQAPRLLGDCDVVLNLALASVPGRPGEARRLNRLVAESAASASAPEARIIHCSTLDVYGDHRPGPRIRWRSAYGKEKLVGERVARRAARRAGRRFYVLRLGHVCGDLQNVTRVIREQIARPPVLVPAVDRPSNTVYTATIVDAVLAIAEGRERPGTYDLLSRPQWSWRAVFRHEATRVGCPVEFEIAQPPDRPSVTARAARLTRIALRSLDNVGWTREMALRVMARIAPSWNTRAQALLYRTRAASEVAALAGRPRAMMDGLAWIDREHRCLATLAPTADLLAASGWQLPALDRARSWPADLPPAAGR